jgi:hypothetical protein
MPGGNSVEQVDMALVKGVNLEPSDNHTYIGLLSNWL